MDSAALSLGPDELRRYLWPAHAPSTQHEHHEAAWALGELFEAAGRLEEAALCRSSTTHEILSVWRWTQSFPDVPAAFWGPALGTLGPRPGPPSRVALSLAGVRAVDWAGKQEVTFSDAITAVRRWLWVEWVFALPGYKPAFEKLPAPFDTPC